MSKQMVKETTKKYFSNWRLIVVHADALLTLYDTPTRLRRRPRLRLVRHLQRVGSFMHNQPHGGGLRRC